MPNQNSDKVDDPVSTKLHNVSSGSSPESIEKANMMPEINSNMKNESKTPTDGGLMIGALNLVSCILYVQTHSCMYNYYNFSVLKL